MGMTKVVLLACGSYNPPTNMHLRMFELARDSLHRVGQFRVVGGVVSPVHDGYGKKELVSSEHRCEMLRLALKSSDWIQLSDWECKQEGWSRTIQVLQHHQNALNSIMCYNNNQDSDNVDHNADAPDFVWFPQDLRSADGAVTVKLLCGADFLESFSIPGLWRDSDVETIIGQHGLVVITREGSNPMKFVYESDLLTRYQRNITIVPEWITNGVSSTKVRRALRRQESVRYLIDDAVIKYITKHQLYGYEGNASKYQNTLKDALSIPLNSYLLTPSPSDVNMRSVSPSKADQEITLSLQPISVLDEPDSAQPIMDEILYKNTTNRNEIRFKSDTEVTQYPGKAVKIVSVEGTPGKSKKVGFADESENARMVVTSIKQSSELKKAFFESATLPSCKSSKTAKKPSRFSDPTRSRNVFKRSNSDVPSSQSNPNLETTSVKIEFTKEGIKIISDKESIV